MLDFAADFVGCAALVFEKLQFLADSLAAGFEFYWLNYCFRLLLFCQLNGLEGAALVAISDAIELVIVTVIAAFVYSGADYCSDMNLD